MNKKYIIVALGTILAFFLLFGGRSADKTAKQAIEALHENDAKKFVSLMYDETIETQMANMEVETKKIFIKNYEKTFDDFQQQMKDTFGKKWKYNATIVDSYDCETPSYFGNKKMNEVVYEITYSGKGLGNKKEETESGTFQLIKQGNKWYIVEFN